MERRGSPAVAGRQRRRRRASVAQHGLFVVDVVTGRGNRGSGFRKRLPECAATPSSVCPLAGLDGRHRSYRQRDVIASTSSQDAHVGSTSEE
jgi:hypothetical protein